MSMLNEVRKQLSDISIMHVMVLMSDGYQV